MRAPGILRVSVDEGMTTFLITANLTWLHDSRISYDSARDCRAAS